MMAATSGLFTCLDMREEPDADVVNGLREHPGGVWSGHMSGAIEQAARRRKDLCGCDRTNKQTDREKKKDKNKTKSHSIMALVIIWKRRGSWFCLPARSLLVTNRFIYIHEMTFFFSSSWFTLERNLEVVGKADDDECLRVCLDASDSN